MQEVARHDRPHNLYRCETFEKLHIFALTSISFKDFPVLKDMIGGSLKISLSSGCSSIILCDKRQNIFCIFFFVLFKR